jgi:DNA-binding HxlR family transcriptional regulator
MVHKPGEAESAPSVSRVGEYTGSGVFLIELYEHTGIRNLFEYWSPITDMNSVESLPTWCTEEDWCPMESASAVLGRKWHPAIVYHLLDDEPLRFSEIESRMHTISGKVLSDSLKDLEEKRLIRRSVTDDRPVKVEYELTEHGRRLRPVIEEMAEWGEQFLADAESPDESVV